MRHTIEAIPPTAENVHTILGLMRSDLEKSQLTAVTIDEIIDSENATRVARLQQKLATTATNFRGIMDDGQLLGYSHSGEQYTGDQRPYVGLLEEVQLRKRDLMNAHTLPGHPLGIFALSVADFIGEAEQQGLADVLLADILERRAADRIDTRVGLRDGELLTPVFENHGFRPTGKYGKPLGALLQLYIRPTPSRE